MTDAHASGSRLPSAERWVLLEPLLDAVLALPPNERPAYLDQACGTDRSLRADIELLLAASERHAVAIGNMEQPAVVRFAALWDDETDHARFERAIDEHFRLEGEVGRGGMALVYRAWDRRNDRVVALKVLRATASAGGAARFRREIALAAQLIHPNIVPLLDSGESAGQLWYTMPLVIGETLGARLRREGRLAVRDTVRILREIVGALAFAHANDVMHRDLKPDNVLLAHGRALIADFGVAKALVTATHSAHASGDIRTATGVGLGTPAYMAPEQAAGERTVDHRADLYALGVIAYELLAGSPPFTGPSRQALITAHLAHAPRPLSGHRSDVPRKLEALVLSLLAKKAADRPGSAAEVAAVLATF